MTESRTDRRSGVGTGSPPMVPDTRGGDSLRAGELSRLHRRTRGPSTQSRIRPISDVTPRRAPAVRQELVDSARRMRGDAHEDVELENGDRLRTVLLLKSRLTHRLLA
jgi:hypothetical protein